MIFITSKYHFLLKRNRCGRQPRLMLITSITKIGLIWWLMMQPL